MKENKHIDENFYIEAAEVFSETFQFRTDTFARQTSNGYVRVNSELTSQYIILHLKGSATYGVFPVFPEENTCHFAVIDIDSTDVSYVKTLIENSLAIGLTEENFLLEFSGMKGYHLWYIFEDKISAFLARKFCQAIIGASLDKVEIFPKQNIVTEGGFGNLIKLPFGLHQESRKWSELIDKVFLEPVDWVNYLNHVHKKIPVEQVGDVVTKFCGPSLHVGEFKPITSDEKLVFERNDGIGKVMDCEFIKHCKNNAETLSEPLWFSMITNLISFKGGREAIHILSKPYQKGSFSYTAQETDAKIQHALRVCYGPHSCEYIAKQGFACAQRGHCDVKSPAGLGTRKIDLK